MYALFYTGCRWSTSTIISIQKLYQKTFYKSASLKCPVSLYGENLRELNGRAMRLDYVLKL